MNDDFRETPSAFRGPFAKANVELSTSTRMTPVAELPPPVQEEIPISQLPLADTLFGREQVAIVQDGITKRATTSAIGASGHAAIDLIKVGSLAYAADVGQTAFPLATPDHYGNTYRLTADNAVQVTVGGLRLAPDDGTGDFGGFNVDLTSNQINLVTGFGSDPVVIVNAGDIVIIDVYALAGAPVSETSTLSLTYPASIGQNVFPLSVPDHYGNTHTLLSNDVVRVTAGGIRLAQDDGSGFGGFNVDYTNNLIVLAPPFSTDDVVIVSGDVVIIDVLVPLPTTNIILSDAPNDGAVYGRKSRAWSRITHNDITDWAAAVAGSAITIASTPPPNPVPGLLWFDDSITGGQTYLWYDDGTSAQWVPIVNQGLTGSGAGPGPPSPSAPSNTAPPVITGTATVGSTLTTTNGAWTNTVLSYGYQWTRNGSNISGATASTYVLTAGDAGTNLRCNVTASNAAGSATAGSNAITILPTAPVNSVPPVVSGSTALGATLTTTDGTWSSSPTLTYLWQRDGVTIAGATASTYVIVTADQGHSLSAVVTATNVAGSASAGSNTLPIPAFTFPATNLVALYSMRKVGAGYGGPCLQIWRADSTFLDIGFNATTGLVDFAAALAYYAGTQPIFVQKWYDQSGGGRHLDWGTGGFNTRPQLNLMNGKPWLSCVYGSMRTATTTILNADLTVGCVAQMQSDIVSVPFSQFDGSSGWFLFGNGSGVSGGVGATPGNMNFFSSQGGIVIADAGRYFGDTNRYVGKRTGGNATLYVNGTQTATGAAVNGGTGSYPITIGQDTGSFLKFYGLLGEMYAYGSTAGAGGALSDANRLLIDANQATTFPDLGFATPYSGTSSVEFGVNQYINCGPVLTYERTNSWTAFAAVQLFASSTFNSGDLMVFYTNVPSTGTAYPGHELWLDTNGHIRVRIISNFGTNVYLGLIGTTYLADGKKHTLAYSYNGSSLASGVKIYIDGVPETTTVEIDALSASIIGGTQNLFIGNQNGFIPGDMTLGTMSFFQIDAVVRSAAYIAANFTGGGQIPPADAATDLRLLLNTGSGSTAVDSSGHTRNGTLASATMWVP